jgi:hypothetical protein
VGDFAVVDNPDEHRYEVLVDGEFAGASYYRDQNGVRFRVRPDCTFTSGYIERHPEYQDLVAG